MLKNLSKTVKRPENFSLYFYVLIFLHLFEQEYNTIIIGAQGIYVFYLKFQVYIENIKTFAGLLSIISLPINIYSQWEDAS